MNFAAHNFPIAAPGCSLLELNDNTCRWPIGEPGEPSFHFCGDATGSCGPYCQTHADQAYQGAPLCKPLPDLNGYVVGHYKDVGGAIGFNPLVLRAGKRRKPAVDVGATSLADMRARHVAASTRLNTALAPIAPETPPCVITKPETPSRTAPPFHYLGSRLDPRFTFENLAQGQANQFALAAAHQVVQQASRRNRPMFDLLCIHGGVGSGKTHLLQAIAHALGRQALYLTADAFSSFREDIGEVDVLLIDDLQFLTHVSVQKHIVLLLDQIKGRGRQVVVASDRIPAAINGLNDRVRSRLAGGLEGEIGMFDENIRFEIVQNKIAASAMLVPSGIAWLIARSIHGGGRDLEGAVTQIITRCLFDGVPVTLDVAQDVLQGLTHSEKPMRFKVEDIQRVVCRHYGVSRTDLISTHRTANIVRPRQVAMYLCKMLTPRSLPEIGRRFGGKDHTTVLHAVRKIGAVREADAGVEADIAAICSTLGCELPATLASAE